jgi:hypothetical protein
MSNTGVDAWDNRINRTVNSDNIVSTDSMEDITKVCDCLKEFMLEKNRRYGNSALDPCDTFGKYSANDTINIYMNAKLKRIKNSDEERMNDHVDLLGYLVLKCVDKGWLDFTELLD